MATDFPARPVILASASAARQKMLRDAGLAFTAIPAAVDETAVREAMRLVTPVPAALADAIAAAKALAVANAHPGALVIGSDQLLAIDDGRLLEKPRSPDEAKAHLRALSARTHTLHAAVVMAAGDRIVWRASDVARMRVRALSDAFIDAYVAQHWQHIRHAVGCYEVEAAGAQLFEAIDGDPYVIMGMPLLPLLRYLREEGIVPQ